MKIANVPYYLQLRQLITFPLHQTGALIEEYAKGFFTGHQKYVSDAWTYLPVFWSGHQVNHEYYRYGGETEVLEYLSALNNDKKYFTVILASKMSLQILDELSRIGCRVYSSAGISGTIPIPLPCDVHAVIRKPSPRFLATFCGSLNTSKVRQDMFEAFKDYGDVYITEPDFHKVQTFEYMMADSTFALCPRGYGPTSYRLYEAMQCGCIPVYITDVEWLPFPNEIGWDDFLVKCHPSELKLLHLRLSRISDKQRNSMQYLAQENYKNFCSYAGTCGLILRDLIEMENKDAADTVRN